LEKIDDAVQRADLFTDYMSVQFRLHALDEAGLDSNDQHARPRANYKKILEGWLFDPNQREGAILKGWVESRFGLLPRWHNGPIRSIDDKQYYYFQQQHCAGLYNTNALEAQLDLLYTYTQYELHRQLPEQAHLRLYRGVNNFSEYELLQEDGEQMIILFNNLNAFSANQERADEFGDKILVSRVPLAKIFFFRQLLPGRLVGEDEFLVIGGLYKCHFVRS
jgi:NAD+--dinitrogen-reductase ADP-D-ribosyltransferase